MWHDRGIRTLRVSFITEASAVVSIDNRGVDYTGYKCGMDGFVSFVEEAGMLDLSAAGKGLRPFRFLKCWLEKRGHVKLMESEWRRISVDVSSPVSILEKLRRLKAFLKVWNRESFGGVDL
ncbi:hypothetical protein V6N13_082591 [Hibiscus sabdariffa]|uniref:Uncharacterized protein n=1 Tax=Hibiscus sabdariffa TaxID=183260 RepID=A0ABR2Q3T9_9ROSI